MMNFFSFSQAFLAAIEVRGDETLSEKLTVGVQTLVVGLATVFAVLIVLWIIIAVVGKIVAAVTEKKNAKKDQPEPEQIANTDTEPVVEEGISDEELVAVITAAVAAYGGENAPRLKIRSVRRAR